MTNLRTNNFGRNGDHIQIGSPSIISAAEIAMIVAALDDALFEISQTAAVAGELFGSGPLGLKTPVCGTSEYENAAAMGAST
jgi:hypothetical protein